MIKVIISQGGRLGWAIGPGAHNQRLTWILADGFDPTEEEFQIRCSPQELEGLKKLKSVQEFRKFKVRTLYKRGENPKLDRQRDEIDLV